MWHNLENKENADILILVNVFSKLVVTRTINYGKYSTELGMSSIKFYKLNIAPLIQFSCASSKLDIKLSIILCTISLGILFYLP